MVCQPCKAGKCAECVSKDHFTLLEGTEAEVAMALAAAETWCDCQHQPPVPAQSARWPVALDKAIAHHDERMAKALRQRPIINIPG